VGAELNRNLFLNGIDRSRKPVLCTSIRYEGSELTYPHWDIGPEDERLVFCCQVRVKHRQILCMLLGLGPKGIKA